MKELHTDEIEYQKFYGIDENGINQYPLIKRLIDNIIIEFLSVQTGFKGDVTVLDGGNTVTKISYDSDKGVTVYSDLGTAGAKVSLKYGTFGETNKVILK